MPDRTEQEKILQDDIAERDTQEEASFREIRSRPGSLKRSGREYETAREALAVSSGDVRALREELEEKRAGILEEMDRAQHQVQARQSADSAGTGETRRLEEVEKELSLAAR